MRTDETSDFIPEHLAKWRKITREYLLAPIELLNRRRRWRLRSGRDSRRDGPQAADIVSPAAASPGLASVRPSSCG